MNLFPIVHHKITPDGHTDFNFAAARRAAAAVCSEEEDASDDEEANLNDQDSNDDDSDDEDVEHDYGTGYTMIQIAVSAGHKNRCRGENFFVFRDSCSMMYAVYL